MIIHYRCFLLYLCQTNSIMKNQLSPTHRLEVVDALRGFALFAIILLHNLEHYNLYFMPEGAPAWLDVLDKGLWDSTWFLLAGKAFSTFSLLFGFSYFIQLSNQQRQGKPFGWRFAWRMVILIVISQFHSLFYNGDILLFYGCMGFLLIPLGRLSNRWILTIATIFLLQPMELCRIITTCINPDSVPFDYGWSYYGAMCKEVMMNGNFAETVCSNITDGQLYGNLWQVSAGRLFQIPALFLFGLLAGRIECFKRSEKSTQFWTRAAITSIIALLLPLNILKNYIPDLIVNERIVESYNNILLSIWNFTFMVALISTFSLLWFYKGNGYKFQLVSI